MEMLDAKFTKHRLKTMGNGQWSKFLRLKSQFGVLRGTEMQRGKKHSFYHMVNDGKPSGNEAEDVTLLLETNEILIITEWIAPNIIYKAQMYIHTGSEELASSIIRMLPFQMKLSRTGPGHLQLPLPLMQLLFTVRIYLL